MTRHDPNLARRGGPRLFCDLTQSWSEVGGGVRTYLLHKRRHILDSTPHSHLMVIPGARDEVIEEERAITVKVASPRVPGSPHYRLMLRNRAVRAALEHFRPDLIECQDAYNLPWVAIAHRRRHPDVALIAAYMTDFPTVYVERPFARFVTGPVANLCSRLCYSYCGALYRRFDSLFSLSENGGAAKLRGLGIDPVEVVPLAEDKLPVLHERGPLLELVRVDGEPLVELDLDGRTGALTGRLARLDGD